MIARLVRERDEARAQMQTQRTALAQAQAAAPAAAAAAVEGRRVVLFILSLFVVEAAVFGQSIDGLVLRTCDGRRLLVLIQR